MAFVLGRAWGVMPNNIECNIVYAIAAFSVLHASCNVIGVFCTDLVGSTIPIRGFNMPEYLQEIGSYSWLVSGIMADFVLAYLSVKKILYIMVYNQLIIYDHKKKWYVPYLIGFIVALPGFILNFWIFLVFLPKLTWLYYDEFVGKYLAATRLILLKGSDIAFLIQIFQQFATVCKWNFTALRRSIPITLEATLYYILSTGLFIFYLTTSDAGLALLLRNLVNKGTEVSSFLFLYYASFKEIELQTYKTYYPDNNQKVEWDDPSSVSNALVSSNGRDEIPFVSVPMLN